MLDVVRSKIDEQISLKHIADNVEDGIEISPSEIVFIRDYFKSISYSDFMYDSNKYLILRLYEVCDLKSIIEGKLLSFLIKDHKNLSDYDLNLLYEIGDQSLIENVLEDLIKCNDDDSIHSIGFNIINFSKNRDNIIKAITLGKGSMSYDLTTCLLENEVITSEDIELLMSQKDKLIQKIDDFDELITLKKLIESKDEDKIKELLIDNKVSPKLTFVLLSKIQDKEWIKDNFGKLSETLVFEYGQMHDLKMMHIVRGLVRDNMDIDSFLQCLDMEISFETNKKIGLIFSIFNEDETFSKKCIEKIFSTDFSDVESWSNERISMLEFVLKGTNDIELVKEFLKAHKKADLADIYCYPDSYFRNVSYEEITDESMLEQVLVSSPEKFSIMKMYIEDPRVSLRNKYKLIGAGSRFHIPLEEVSSILEAKEKEDLYKKEEEKGKQPSSNDRLYEIKLTPPDEKYLYTGEQVIKISEKIKEIISDIKIPERGNEEQELRAFLKLCEKISFIRYDFFAITKTGVKNKSLQEEVRNLVRID